MPDSTQEVRAVSVQMALMNHKLNTLIVEVGTIKSILDDDRSGPGLLTRVDRMEQTSQRQNWYHGVWLVAVVGVVVTWLSNKLGIH